MKGPTKLKKMKLNSVDFVRRGANPSADIALFKSADYIPEDEKQQSFFRSLTDGITGAIRKAFSEAHHDIQEGIMMDVAKAEQDLTLFTDVLGESFSSIMKDDSLNPEEIYGMIQKSLSEFNDTVDDYLSSLSILEKSSDSLEDYQTAADTFKSSNLRKGDDAEMKIYEDVDKSLLTPTEASMLDALVAKASTTEKKFAPGKVNPAAAQEEEEENAGLAPEVKKALEEVENLKKSLEMKELEEVAKKYEILGKKASEEAQVLYDLKKSGEGNYNAYIAAMDAQVGLVEKSGMFAEIGKSGVGAFSSVAKSEPETKIETIAKSYMEKDPTLDYNTAVAKAWENNPDLMAAYDSEFLG